MIKSLLLGIGMRLFTPTHEMPVELKGSLKEDLKAKTEMVSIKENKSLTKLEKADCDRYWWANGRYYWQDCSGNIYIQRQRGWHLIRSAQPRIPRPPHGYGRPYQGRDGIWYCQGQFRNRWGWVTVTIYWSNGGWHRLR